MHTDSSYYQAYRTALTALNRAQRQAVECTDGPVLVIAGPGTGKTQILTLRIAHILQTTDAAPEHILALTFTDSGAKAMRDRLRHYIGTDAYRVPIHTFHGFADTLIRQYPDAFGRIVGGTTVSDIERISYIETIIADGTYHALRPVGNPYYHVTHVLRQISAMKREYISPGTLRTIIDGQAQELGDTPQYHESGAHAGKVRGDYTKLEKQVQKNRELLQVYEAYEALLRSEGRYDFEDMILETVAALQEHEDLLRELQETYQYVLADEHQDVNASQNKILELLVSYHDRPNIFVVGDEKQAIYRFQGASLANFLYFGDKFTDTTTIDLTENYRSGQNILDAAQAVIATDDAALQKLRVPLTARAVSESSVTMRTCAHDVYEEEWLVQAIADALDRGVPAQEIAVMVRTNQLVEHVAHILRARGVAVNASADSDINRHPITQHIRALLRAAQHPERGDALATLLHAPYWGISIADVQRVLGARSYRQGLYDLLSDPAALAAAGVSDVDAVMKIMRTIDELRAESVTRLPHRLVELAIHRSGLLAYVHAHDAIEGGRVVRRLYDTIERHVRSGEMRAMGDIERVLQRYESYNVPLAAPYMPTGGAAVQVMTAHKAKGLEFSVVFAPYLSDAAWGGKVRRDQFAVPLSATAGAGDESDDDRRLLYVVMTRAKDALHLSYSTQNADGKERALSRLLVPLESVDAVEWIDMPVPDDISLATTVPHDDRPNRATLFDLAMIRAVLAERGLSATSANNYRSSPWNYFYRNVLRWPELPTLSLRYGTVIHSCLEYSVATFRREGRTATVDELRHHLTGELERLPLTAAEFAQLHEKGLAELTVYHEHLSEQLHEVEQTSIEMGMRVILPLAQTSVPELPLVGTLDRVDRDAAGRITRVVDYKTGAPKTRNAILGKTKQGDDGYAQQLYFYALLLYLHGEHHDDIAYTLSFVRPLASGKIREEAFYITESEILTTKADIERIASEIAEGSFLDTPCDPATSEYCELVAALSENASD